MKKNEKTNYLKRYKKEIIISLIYIGLSIGIYFLVDLKKMSETFDIINMLGIGIFGASLLIRVIEKFANGMIESGRLSGVKKVEETKYTIYTSFFGISSLILSIVKVILIS